MLSSGSLTVDDNTNETRNISTVYWEMVCRWLVDSIINKKVWTMVLTIELVNGGWTTHNQWLFRRVNFACFDDQRQQHSLSMNGPLPLRRFPVKTCWIWLWDRGIGCHGYTSSKWRFRGTYVPRLWVKGVRVPTATPTSLAWMIARATAQRSGRSIILKHY